VPTGNYRASSRTHNQIIVSGQHVRVCWSKYDSAITNLYLLGLSNTNTTDATNGANACAVQLSADKITLNLNNVVFDEWRAFAIGYNGQWDKFFISIVSSEIWLIRPAVHRRSYP